MCPTARYVSIAVALSTVSPPSAMTEHLVPRTEMAERLQAAAAERASNQAKIQRFLSRRIPARTPGVDIQGRLGAGVAALSDDELRDLARRADALQTDPVAAGTGKILIIVGVVVLVVVLLAAAVVKTCREQGVECLN